MADELNGAVNDLISNLRHDVKDKSDKLVRTGAKLRDTLKEVRELAAARDALVKERDTAIAQAERLRQELDPTPLKTELEKLRGEVVESKHRAVFDAAARARGADDSTIDLIYKLSGYRAAGEPDPDAIGKLQDGMRDAPGTGRLFGSTAGASPAVGSGQGGRNVLPGKFRVTEGQLKNGPWMMEHSDAVQRALDENNLEIVES